MKLMSLVLILAFTALITDLTACVSDAPKKDAGMITITQDFTFPKSTIGKFRRDCLTTPMAIMKSADIPLRRFTLTREFLEVGKGTPKDNIYCRFENARLGEVLKFIDDNDIRKICPRAHVLNHDQTSATDDELVAVAPKLTLACAPE